MHEENVEKVWCFAKRRSLVFMRSSLTAGTRRPQFRARRPDWPQFSDLVTFVKWKITILGGWKGRLRIYWENMVSWQLAAHLCPVVNEERKETRPKTKAGNDQRRRRRRIGGEGVRGGEKTEWISKLLMCFWLLAASLPPIWRGQIKWSKDFTIFLVSCELRNALPASLDCFAQSMNVIAWG